jgi:PIN domain nuclease of toxin-antitoxin system
VESVIRLDTHVVVWLYNGESERLSATAVEAIEANELLISPMVQLELTYLHEIGRLTTTGAEIVDDLRDRIGLRMSEVTTIAAVRAATRWSWTRDPFDRLITADAEVSSSPLVTRDQIIRENCSFATW